MIFRFLISRLVEGLSKILQFLAVFFLFLLVFHPDVAPEKGVKDKNNCQD